MSKRHKLIGLVAFFFIAQFTYVHAQSIPSTEGLWLPEQLPQIRANMKQLGNMLENEKIYNEQSPSLKDGVVRINNGQCSGALISASGLVLSNHHCLLETLPSVEIKNWREGFWAKSLEEEVAIPELSVEILVRTENVTKRVIGPSFEDYAGIEARKKEIIEEATKGTPYTAEVLSFYHGREYRLYVYEQYSDIRLASLPSNQLARWSYGPDEWDWPRYGADFVLLRIYMAPDSTAAAYSKENIPYQSKFHFPISLEKRQEGDFAMVMGYPGATNRYVSARGLQHIVEKHNPDKIDLLAQKARLISELLEDKPAKSVAISDEYKDVARTAHYYRGQLEMLHRFDVLAQREQTEMALKSWIFKNPQYEKEYGKVLRDIDSLYQGYEKYDRFVNMLYRGLLASEASSWSLPFLFRIKPLLEKASHPRALQDAMKPIKVELNDYFERFHSDLDQKVFYQGLLQFYQKVDADLHPRIFRQIMAHKSARKGKTTEDRLKKWVEYAYETSVLTEKNRMRAFITKPELSIMKKDPIFNFVEAVVDYYRSEIALEEARFYLQLNIRNRIYAKALNDMARKQLYPDANTSLRISYGQLGGYEPRDAIIYETFCHFSGMLEEQTEEFRLPSKLVETWQKMRDSKSFQKLPVAFLSNNDISAGNSGSPVINARGQLIGCVFDANREAMASDYRFIPEYQRTLSVDIKFIIWLIKYLGEADYLLEELKLVGEI